jgi:hypothetical protein
MIREAEMKMRFFRHRRGFAGLALVALAAQFVLALGHTHAAGASPRWLTASTASIACRSFLPPALDKPCPPRHSDEHDCPICWTASLAGSLVLPESPALVLPASRSEPLKLNAAAVPRVTYAAAAFHARGPPLA